MEQLIELSPFILGGISLISLIAAAIVRATSEDKRQSKAYKILSFAGFLTLFIAAGIAVWVIFTSF